MKKRLILTVLGATLLAAPATALAGGYGSAGCGLGGMLLGDKPGILQIFAATTNAIFFNQTFAITTGTSGCGDARISAQGAKVFIEANREALSKDIARGGGETVKNLATLAGCPNADVVGTKLQQNFSSIFPVAETPTEQVVGTILETMKSDVTLACANLS